VTKFITNRKTIGIRGEDLRTSDSIFNLFIKLDCLSMSVYDRDEYKGQEKKKKLKVKNGKE